jgi:hypothetical protein
VRMTQRGFKAVDAKCGTSGERHFASELPRWLTWLSVLQFWPEPSVGRGFSLLFCLLCRRPPPDEFEPMALR